MPHKKDPVLVKHINELKAAIVTISLKFSEETANLKLRLATEKSDNAAAIAEEKERNRMTLAAAKDNNVRLAREKIKLEVENSDLKAQVVTLESQIGVAPWAKAARRVKGRDL